MEADCFENNCDRTRPRCQDIAFQFRVSEASRLYTGTASRQCHAGKGRPRSDGLLESAKARQYAATIAALAALCLAPIDTIREILNEGRNEPLLVFCKAAGLSWLTLRM